jgi:hypothetical protein
MSITGVVVAQHTAILVLVPHDTTQTALVNMAHAIVPRIISDATPTNVLVIGVDITTNIATLSSLLRAQLVFNETHKFVPISAIVAPSWTEYARYIEVLYFNFVFQRAQCALDRDQLTKSVAPCTDVQPSPIPIYTDWVSLQSAATWVVHVFITSYWLEPEPCNDPVRLTADFMRPQTVVISQRSPSQVVATEVVMLASACNVFGDMPRLASLICTSTSTEQCIQRHLNEASRALVMAGIFQKTQVAARWILALEPRLPPSPTPPPQPSPPSPQAKEDTHSASTTTQQTHYVREFFAFLYWVLVGFMNVCKSTANLFITVIHTVPAEFLAILFIALVVSMGALIVIVIVGAMRISSLRPQMHGGFQYQQQQLENDGHQQQRPLLPSVF